MEGVIDRSNSDIAIANQQRRYTNHRTRTNRQYAKRPPKAETLNHRLRRQTINQPPDARPSSTNRIRKTPPLIKPLRNQSHGGIENQAHAETETDALGEEEVPDLGGEGGPQQSAGLEDDAEKEGGVEAVAADEEGGEGGDDLRHCDGEAADEGVFEGAGAGEEAVLEVVREEDAVRLGRGLACVLLCWRKGGAY